MKRNDLDSKLIAIAQQYNNPDEFKAMNFAKYSICKGKGLLRKAFPSYVKPLKVWPKPLQAIVPETPSDASLRHAIDDLIVKYRARQKDKGVSSTIPVGTVIRELTKVLKNH